MNVLDKDNLVVLVYTILVDPVRVQHSQIATSTTDTLLGGSTETSLEFEVVDTLTDGFTVGGTYETGRDRLLAKLFHNSCPLLCSISSSFNRSDNNSVGWHRHPLFSASKFRSYKR